MAGTKPGHGDHPEVIAMSDFSIVVSALEAGGVMVYPLFALTVLAFVIILEKGFVFAVRARLPHRLTSRIESASFAWEELEARVASLGRRSPVAAFLAVILANRGRPAWWTQSQAEGAAARIEAELGRGLWLLETIVTAAPLLGLLGTITGMVRAFRLFGAGGLVDPAGVTGGVAEALIATALGLFIALLALFAFNFFSQRQAELMDRLERIGTRLIDRIRLDAGEAPDPEARDEAA
jgi:biopolymer transport protein ExbB